MNGLLRHPVRSFRLHRLDVLRERLPMGDPDRHALDVVADQRFAALAPGCPDLAASRAAGFEPPLVWDQPPVRRRPAGYSPDCEPEFVDRPAADVQTGGVL